MKAIANHLLRWWRPASVRALRGATTVAVDTPEAIGAAVEELLSALREQNRIRDGDVVSAIFTMTADLSSAFPATTARQLGWHDVPLLCASEIAVPGGLPRCVRVLVHVNGKDHPRHVYLRDAVVLRPDWCERGASATLRST